MTEAQDARGPTALDRLHTTRLGLQSVAEQVLAPALYAATGHIGLRAAPGGIATPWFDTEAGARRLRIDGLDLVVEQGDDQRRTPLTTVAAAAEVAGVSPGVPAGLYTPATPLVPDATLELDLGAARRLADLYAAVNEALVAFGREQHAPQAQLWPEHFDLALTADQVNYGGSPGDAEHPEPYLYVGPWSPPPPDGEFWNEPFGATRPAPAGITAAAVASFFRQGLSRLDGRPPVSRSAGGA
jgi:hypothetical protein